MRGQYTRNKVNTQAYQIFVFTAMLRKPVVQHYQVNINMNEAKNAPAQYLAKPIADVYISHTVKLCNKILKIACVLINGLMEV